MKILIADDEKDLGVLLGPSLKRRGFEDVAFTLHPAATVEKIREWQPDVVLLDVNFEVEGFDGFEVLRQAKPLSPSTKFIMFSAYREYEDRAHSLGADFLAKPATGSMIIEKIKSMIT